jgi:tetratricopeptide (TPR) repeat protein
MTRLSSWLEVWIIVTAYPRELFDEFDTSADPYYETNKQHLGRILVQLRQYDKAYELIQSTSQSPLLQSPGCQARNFRTFSDFFFAIGDHDKGLEFAQKTAEPSNTYGLKIQKIGIQQVLARYDLPSSVLSHV